jgi:hypothetical protein
MTLPSLVVGDSEAAAAPVMAVGGLHRRAGVEEDLAAHVGVVLELFDVILVSAGPDLPIDVAEVVPLGVRAVG